MIGYFDPDKFRISLEIHSNLTKAIVRSLGSTTANNLTEPLWRRNADSWPFLERGF